MNDFKTEFKKQITTLDQAITSAVEMNNQSKKEFSTTVIDGLTVINQRIMALADDIKKLKDELAGLQNQVLGNNGQIENNNTRLRELEEQNAQLTNQRDAAVAELDTLKQQYIANTKDFQEKINKLEEQLRQLTAQMNAITLERDALRTELNGKGDLANEPTQLKKLTTAHEQQLKTQEEGCNVRLREIQKQIDFLQAEINIRDNNINDLTQQLENKSSELQSKIEKLTAQNTLNENEIRQKTEIVDSLQAENNELMTLITEATESVKKAISRLSEFNNPDSFDIAGRDRILEEINTSIEKIRTLINGVANSQAQLANPSEESSEEYIIQGVRFNKKNLIQKLAIKARNVPNNAQNKYASAIEKIKKGIISPEQVFIHNNIRIKELDTIMGGKTKRRKYNKQRGGFTYKNNAKRRPFTSKLRTTSTGSNFARGKSKKLKALMSIRSLKIK